MVLRNFVPFKVDERGNVIFFCNYPGGTAFNQRQMKKNPAKNFK